MIEIYWLTRLDAVVFAASVMVVFAIVALVASFAAKAEYGTLDAEDCVVPKWAPKMGIALLIVGGLLLTFVPSKKDALLILGVGGTMEYLESNETAKQLPEKCVKALGKFADEYLLDEEE